MITRAYNTITVDKNKGTILKESRTERLQDELAFYRKIHTTSLSKYFPELIDYDRGDGYWFELQYYPYENLGQQLINYEHSIPEWLDILGQLYYVAEDIHATIAPDNTKTYSNEMYIQKTEAEYGNLVKSWGAKNPELIGTLIDPYSLHINGKYCLNFPTVWDSAKRLIETYTYTPTVIHGDMCFSNILYEDGDFKFVDPRGSFGEVGIYGDAYYDYAKILHSIDGLYESIIYDNFELTSGWHISHKIDESFTRIMPGILECLMYDKDYERAKLIEGTIYVGMVNRHYDSVERQKTMYLTGIRILNEVLESL